MASLTGKLYSTTSEVEMACCGALKCGGGRYQNAAAAYKLYASQPDGGGNEHYQEEDDATQTKPEFQPVVMGAAGPYLPKQAYLTAHQGKVDVDSKIGSVEIIHADAVAATSTTTMVKTPSSRSVSIKVGVVLQPNQINAKQRKRSRDLWCQNKRVCSRQREFWGGKQNHGQDVILRIRIYQGRCCVATKPNQRQTKKKEKGSFVSEQKILFERVQESESFGEENNGSLTSKERR
jgi:hypothetical protein